MDKAALSHAIKAKCQEMGFDLVGIAQAGFLEPEARDLEQFLNRGLHGKMEWLAGHFDKRVDPRLLVDGAKSVISVLLNYFPDPAMQQPADAPKISTYAWGKDYHKVIKQKLYRVLEHIQEIAGDVNARVFTDSAPVMDKAWAKRAGLGWIGKHTNLVHPKMGSWYFIGEIIVDLELDYDGPMKDYCGTCTRCLDACPTDALQPYEIDATKCISYLTIELREDMPAELRGATDGWAYGCDICQEVCPWNSFSVPTTEEEFQPFPHILEFTRKDWEAVTEQQFKRLIKKSAMSRIKYVKWDDNVAQLDGGSENNKG